MQRSFNDLGSVDALTPQSRSRSSSMRKNADEMFLASHYSPGLLDLHAFDTELLPEVGSVSLLYSFLFLILKSRSVRMPLCHLLMWVCFDGLLAF